jgi:hypothetical protein
MVKSKRRTFGNLEGEIKQAKDVTALSQWVEAQFDPSFNVESVKWVRKLWKRKLILKGIMHIDDAKLAMDLGVMPLLFPTTAGVSSTARPPPSPCYRELPIRWVARSKCISMAAFAPAAIFSKGSAAVQIPA